MKIQVTNMLAFGAYPSLTFIDRDTMRRYWLMARRALIQEGEPARFEVAVKQVAGQWNGPAHVLLDDLPPFRHSRTRAPDRREYAFPIVCQGEEMWLRLNLFEKGDLNVEISSVPRLLGSHLLYSRLGIPLVLPSTEVRP